MNYIRLGGRLVPGSVPGAAVFARAALGAVMASWRATATDRTSDSARGTVAVPSVTTFTYDRQGRLTRIDEPAINAQRKVRFTYSADGGGNAHDHE